MAIENNNKITNKYISDTLSLVGIVIIENGNNKVTGTNHWVGQGLETIGSYLVGGASNGAASSIYIGSDTLIPTTVSMTGLVSPIGSSPGTAPNTFSVSYSINLNSTVPATVLYTAVWNAGTVSGTLGEVGLYIKGYTGGLSGSTYATNPGLGARMASADGAFTPFTITTTVALTVSWFVKFVYSSGTSVTQYITSPSLPSDPSQQPIVGITNSQSIPVPAGLQVMWQAPISLLQAYFSRYGINLNSNLSNMRILYNGQYVPAWIESINNGIATIWMKMPVSIPANSSISLSLNAGPSFNFDGVYWGESPQLSSTYGKYDNGASVFNNYWNFAGTSLPSGWSGSGYTVNNGITINAPGGANQTNYIITNTASYNTNQITEFYFPSGFSFGQPSGGSYGINEGWCLKRDTGTTRNNAIQVVNYYGAAGTQFQTVVNGTATSSSTFTSGPSSFISTMYSTSAGAVFGIGTNPPLYNNSQSATLTSNIYTGNSYIYLWSFDSNTSVGPVYYIRTRALPPNGVMPSVSLL